MLKEKGLDFLAEIEINNVKNKSIELILQENKIHNS
jgi:hypothetical protein